MPEPSLERYEERGFFLEIPFPDENSVTVLYIADKDFVKLKDLTEDSDSGWEPIRDELCELLEHSGHDEDHTFTESLVENISEVIGETHRPEETEIKDPLEDLPNGIDPDKN